MKKKFWHSVEKGDLPKEFGTYLILCKNMATNELNYYIATYNSKAIGYSWYDTFGAFDNVKYWAEIPKLQEAELV
jgi:hypothetical protein